MIFNLFIFIKLLKLQIGRKKQDEIESKIDNLYRQNLDLIVQNKELLNEVNNKSEYTKTLEHLFMFILDFFMKKNDNSGVSGAAPGGCGTSHGLTQATSNVGSVGGTINHFNTTNAAECFNHIIDKSKELFKELREGNPITTPLATITSSLPLNTVKSGSINGFPMLEPPSKIEDNEGKSTSLGAGNLNNINNNINNLMLPEHTVSTSNSTIGINNNMGQNINTNNLTSPLQLMNQNSNYSSGNLLNNLNNNYNYGNYAQMNQMNSNYSNIFSGNQNPENLNQNNVNSPRNSLNLDNLSNFNLPLGLYNNNISDFFDNNQEMKMSRKSSSFSLVPNTNVINNNLNTNNNVYDEMNFRNDFSNDNNIENIVNNINNNTGTTIINNNKNRKNSNYTKKSTKNLKREKFSNDYEQQKQAFTPRSEKTKFIIKNEEKIKNNYK
jgi:hypothetical protein